MKKKMKFAFAGMMAFIILAMLCSIAVMAIELSTPVDTEEEWVMAFRLTCFAEGDENTIGDTDLENKAYGKAQIRQPYLVDALWWAERNSQNSHAAALLFWDRKVQGLTSEKLLGLPQTVSYSVFRCYMNRWASREKIGFTPTVEDIIRIHNGGGPGYGKPEWKRRTEPHVNRFKRDRVVDRLTSL